MTAPPSNLTAVGDESPVLARLSEEQRERLTEVLDRHMSAIERGCPLDRSVLIAENPDLADALRFYFRSLEDLHDMAAGFAAASLTEGPSPGEDAPSRRIGDFELIREIGRGGMGVVYEARQISLGRRVALKLLPFAAVLDARQIARFRSEAQAAAEVQHPNIVPVFAMGVERGVHYYAMQFIEGQPLDRAIAELREVRGRTAARSAGALSLRNRGREISAESPSRELTTSVTGDPTPPCAGGPRPAPLQAWSALGRSEYVDTVARLGIQAAEALHAAHEHGVIHRDVKPSNLLLDVDGKLWVTDFGLARCHRDASLTRTGDIVGTMRYMSPEQAAGGGALVDQRTDVYSLGVTLYELLCLESPFPEEHEGPLAQPSHRGDPVPLRKRRPDIPVDLETVVLKAMAAEREDRYATARELADDLRRVLEGRPTLARPPSLADRTVKWVRRHRRVVQAGVAVLLLAVVGLAAGMLAIARERDQAQANFRRSERYFRDARVLLDEFGMEFSQRLVDVPGAEEARRELLQRSLAYYRKYIDDLKDAPELRADMALTYSQIAELAGKIGSPDDAVKARREASRLFEELVAADPARRDYQQRLALCENNLALALHRAGDLAEARRHFARAIRLQQQLTATDPDDAAAMADLALSCSNLGLLQKETGEAALAQGSFRSAVELLEPLVAGRASAPERRRQLAAACNNLAGTYLATNPQQAAALHEQALGHLLAASEARPAALDYRRETALTLNNLAAACVRTGRLDQALLRHKEAIALQEDLVRRAPARRAYQADLAASHNNLGLDHLRCRHATDAEASFRQSLEMYEKLLQEQPGDCDLQSSLGGVYNNLGMVLEQTSRWSQAAEAFSRAVEHQRQAVTRAPEVDRFRAFLSKHYYNLGRVLRQSGRIDEAVQAATARKELRPRDGRHLFSVAEELAAAWGAATASGAPPESREACAQLAAETLQQAVAAGYVLPSAWESREPFSALRGSPDFTALVSQP